MTIWFPLALLKKQAAVGCRPLPRDTDAPVLPAAAAGPELSPRRALVLLDSRACSSQGC